jgi:hypothetical protein
MTLLPILQSSFFLGRVPAGCLRLGIVFCLEPSVPLVIDQVFLIGAAEAGWRRHGRHEPGTGNRHWRKTGRLGAVKHRRLAA